MSKIITFGTNVNREAMISLIPNLAALDEYTSFQVYREFKFDRQVVELTIFYREPGRDKMRIDAEFDSGFEDETLDYRNIRIVQWVKATDGVRL